MVQFIVVVFLAIFLSVNNCSQNTSQSNLNRDLNNAQIDTCDNPDANINCCFLNMPASLTHIMTIASPNEPGDKLIITGTLFKPDGVTPYPNVILYVYHTDNTGHYTKKGNEKGFQKWHGYLHGWCKSDNHGNYELYTIRPARYPDNSMPAHIHAAIRTPKGEMNYLNDFVFKDDSLVNEKYLSSLNNMGGTGVVDLKRNAENSWTGKRDIVLKK